MQNTVRVVGHWMQQQLITETVEYGGELATIVYKGTNRFSYMKSSRCCQTDSYKQHESVSLKFERLAKINIRWRRATAEEDRGSSWDKVRSGSVTLPEKRGPNFPPPLPDVRWAVNHENPPARLPDTSSEMCAHPATRAIVLRRKPHPSGARVDLNKPGEAFGKQCLSQVWRRSPDDAPSADRHDKQFLCERRRPFGSRLDKVLALSQTAKKYLQ